MGLNIMIAGCAKEKRDDVEASVKAAFGNRADTEPWTVSLVHIANQWSIEIDGPDPQFKGLSLVAPASELTQSLHQALSAAQPSPAAAPAQTPAAPAPAQAQAQAQPHAQPQAAPVAVAAAPAPQAAPQAAPPDTAGEKTDSHVCEECAAAFNVVYDALAGESREMCPVACPACWHVNKVPIAEAAGATGDYRAELSS